MPTRRAVLIKRSTDDGLIEVEDRVPLGRVYQVRLETLRQGRGFNLKHGKFWQHTIISDVTGGWLPIEILEIEGIDGDPTARHDRS